MVIEEADMGKGTLGKDVTEALNLWVKSKKEEEISIRQLYLLKKGQKFGKYRFRREDIDER